MAESLPAIAGVLAVVGVVVAFMWGSSRGGARLLREFLQGRRQPRLSAMLPAPACPFCGQEMRPGRLLTRGTPVFWEPSDARAKNTWTMIRATKGSQYAQFFPLEQEMLIVGRSHRSTRGASLCARCGAVVVDPAPDGVSEFGLRR